MSASPIQVPVEPIERSLLAPLARLRGRCRLYLALEGAVRLGVALIGAGFVQLLLDRWLRFSVDQRAFLNTVITVFWLWVIYRYLVVTLVQPLADDSLAAVVDNANPDLHDQIATAVQFATGRVGSPDFNSPALVAAVLQDTQRVTASLSFADVLNHRRAMRRAIELSVLTVLVAAAFTLPITSELMSTWFKRNWLLADLAWPQNTYLTAVDFDEAGRRRVPLGDELEITAVLRGEAPTSAELTWSTPSGRRGRETMTLRGGTRFVASVGVVTEDVHFRMVGGDESTREYVAVAVPRPQIIRSLARITPPEYTGLEPAILEQQTVLEVLRGSVLEIDAWLNKPIASAEFVSGEGLVAACELLAPDHVRVRLATAAPPASQPASAPSSAPASQAGLPQLDSGSYRFEVVDRDGWNDRRPIRFTIKVIADRAPNVQMKTLGVGEFITPQAEIRTELQFDDAYGLSVVRLLLQKGEAPPLVLPLDGFEPPQRAFQAEPQVNVSGLGVAPGDRVRILAEASDRDPHGPNVGRAASSELRVLSPEDFLTEMARRELELRREFERLIGEQRVMNDALERLLPGLSEAAAPPGAAQQLAGLARRQNTQAARCLSLRRQFEQILAETQTSKVARAGEERRITERIAIPLGVLGHEGMPAAAEVLATLRSGATSTRVDAVRQAQADILRQMKSILANMLEWEGYREAVALLREIIAAQAEVRSETLKAVEKQLEAILELDFPPDPAPNSAPKR